MGKEIRRINLYGGPGAGKSTATARIFSSLKELGYPIEHCTEYVKRWVYLKREVNKHDQIYLFAKQQQSEYSCLNNGIQLIVSDSPCLLSYFYAVNHNVDSEIQEALWLLNKSYERDFPSINIFLDRKNKVYNPQGRWQSEAQARDIDSKMLEVLKSSCSRLFVSDYNDPNLVNRVDNSCPII